MIKRCLASILLFTSLCSLANPLPATEVFKTSVHRLDPNTLLMEWSIKPGYFLYKERFDFIKQSNSDIHVGNIAFPKAEEKTDRQGHKYLVYRNKLIVPVSVLSEQAGETLIDVHFQGCSDEGFCYPPEINQIKLSFDPKLALSEVSLESANDVSSTRTDNKASNAPHTTETNFEALFSSGSFIWIVLCFFGFGLLLAFTPCVLPMIPVLSGIIVGHGHNISTRKAFFLSLSYVLSMSATYGIVGAVIALLGSNLQIFMQSPIIIGLFSLIFILLALSMFNFYEFRLPLAMQNKLASLTRSQSSGHYLSAAIMGCLSTLILSPCVTAPLIGALSYIAQTGDIILGLFSLFFLSLGMGMPLLLIGTSAGKLLPKAGTWMNSVKTIFGIILIAVSINLMSRILPSILTMILWSGLLIMSGIYLKPFCNTDTHLERFKQGLGIILVAYGVFILYGASAGHTNPLLPLKITQLHNAPILTEATASSSIVVHNIKEAELALNHAKNKNIPVMVDFYADWCTSCKIIANTTLQNKNVLNALQNIMVIKADITKNDTNTKDLLAYFHIVAPPTFLFFDAEGNALNKLQLVGDISADTLLDRLHYFGQ